MPMNVQQTLSQYHYTPCRKKSQYLLTKKHISLFFATNKFIYLFFIIILFAILFMKFFMSFV